MIITPLENETYNEYIQRILKDREENHIDTKKYYEHHHIVPKCIGGSNDDANLIILYPQEHYYAHKLLALENPSIQGLQYAWFIMSRNLNNYNMNRDILVSADEYAEARKRFSDIVKEKMGGENNPGFGKHRSEETKQKISEANKGRKREKRSEESKKKQSETLKGMFAKEKHPMWGKTHTKEAKEKMSKKAKGRTFSEEHKQKIANSRIGKNNGNIGSNHGRSRQVQCIETGQVFGTLKEAGEWAGLTGSCAGSSIGACCNGKRKTAGKNPNNNTPVSWKFI